MCRIKCLKIDTVKAISNIIPQMHSTPQLRSELFGEIKRKYISPEQPFSSPILLSAYCNAHQTLERMLDGNFLEALPKQREELFLQDRYQRLWKNVYKTTKQIEDILVIHAMVFHSQSILINRKIGVLAGGSLAILAPATRLGDEVYAFCPSPPLEWNAKMYLLVLRPQLIESGIDAGNPEYETKQDDEEWGNTRHFTMIECAWTNLDDVRQLRRGFASGEYARRKKWWDLRTTAWVH